MLGLGGRREGQNLGEASSARFRACRVLLPVQGLSHASAISPFGFETTPEKNKSQFSKVTKLSSVRKQVHDKLSEEHKYFEMEPDFDENWQNANQNKNSDR